MKKALLIVLCSATLLWIVLMSAISYSRNIIEKERREFVSMQSKFVDNLLDSIIAKKGDYIESLVAKRTANIKDSLLKVAKIKAGEISGATIEEWITFIKNLPDYTSEAQQKQLWEEYLAAKHIKQSVESE